MEKRQDFLMYIEGVRSRTCKVIRERSWSCKLMMVVPGHPEGRFLPESFSRSGQTFRM